MCSVLAYPGSSISLMSADFIHPLLTSRRYRTDSDLLSFIRDNQTTSRFISSVVSAPPCLGVPASIASCSSTWSSKARNHYDMALRVMLKKHECQFKLSQGRRVVDVYWHIFEIIL